MSRPPAGVALLGGLVFLVGACGLGQGPTGYGSGVPETTVGVVARDLAFAPTALAVPSGVVFELAFDNQDPGILHNVTIVSLAGGVVFRGETFAGIDRRAFLVAPLAGGDYRLRCDAHPTMSGRLLAAP